VLRSDQAAESGTMDEHFLDSQIIVSDGFPATHIAQAILAKNLVRVITLFHINISLQTLLFIIFDLPAETFRNRFLQLHRP
jgi:hypothetical protein